MKQANGDTREMAGKKGRSMTPATNSPATNLNESYPGFRVRLPSLVRVAA